MAYDPPPLITRESPRRGRRRRRAQQQSSCCCCSIVAVSLLMVLIVWRGSIFSIFHRQPEAKEPPAARMFPLELSSDATQYLRYNLVRITATVRDAQGVKRTIEGKPPEIIVTRNGEIVTTIGDFTSVTPRYHQPSQTYVAHWPIPWNAPVGEYLAEARLKVENPETWSWETEEQQRERRRERKRNGEPAPPEGDAVCVARARFFVTGRAPNPAIPKGTCVASWEPDFPADRVRRTDGTMGDWKAMFDWCEFMGADTLWFRGAVTEAYKNTPRTMEQPFKPNNLQAIPLLAAEAKHRGLRFGTWVAAYSTYPHNTNRYKPPYKYAQDISRSTGAVSSLDFVSLLDPDRLKHVTGFLSQVQADPNVDYLGLDYMRSDRGGYEMVDRFTSEMPLRLPENFSRRSRSERWGYVAKKREMEWQSDPKFYDSWNWWRAHVGAQNVASMIQQGQLSKPLWIFVLSWWHGKQHGQDPLMFTDAGASVLAPMLYQVDSRGMYDSMVRDWNEYLGQGQANIFPGDQVDYRWHQKLRNPAAPEEMYDRMVTAHRKFHATGLTVGMFLHDISRATTPDNNGPYPGTEWALAGGAAFSTLRMNWRVFPIVATLQMPAAAPLDTTVEGQLTLQNVVKRDVKRVTLQLEKTEGVELVGELKSEPLLRAERTVTLPVRVRIRSGHADRLNRLMVCVRIRWSDDDYGEGVRRDLRPMILVMDYVQGR